MHIMQQSFSLRGIDSKHLLVRRTTARCDFLANCTGGFSIQAPLFLYAQSRIDLTLTRAFSLPVEHSNSLWSSRGWLSARYLFANWNGAISDVLHRRGDSIICHSWLVFTLINKLPELLKTSEQWNLWGWCSSEADLETLHQWWVQLYDTIFVY